VERAESHDSFWSAALVSERLRTLAELSTAVPPRSELVDMSSRAVSARLIECAEISGLVWLLAGHGAQPESAPLGSE
jgi:hypothetical protein